jgi:beta-glucanase (GH16 family)
MQRHMAGALRAARMSKFLLPAAVLSTLAVLVAVTPAGAAHRGKDRATHKHAVKKHTKRNWRTRVKAVRARYARDKVAPSAPTGLGANPGNTQVKLAWNASTDKVGVNGYRVFRGGTAVASVNASTLSWTDAGLVNGTTYSYTVKAVDGGGNWSRNSNTATATPVATLAPTPPPTAPVSGGDGSSPTPPPIAGKAWSLRMNDEFASIDPARWTYKFWWNADTFWPNHELQVYQPGACASDGTQLNMTASRASGLTGSNGQTANSDGEPYQYSSCFMSTGGTQTAPAGYLFTYGYAEARMWVSGGKGVWPGFWMQGRSDTNGSFNDSQEIDVLELIGSSPSTAEMHFHGPSGTYGANYTNPTPLTAGWHTYAIDWEPGQLTWYIDGVQRARLSRSDVPTTPRYLMLNLAVGGSHSWPGAPDGSTPFPSQTKVDWVRVWQ